MKQLRIAHITATFPPYQAGTGNVCYHNASELAKLGHDVHVYTSGIPGIPDKETIAGVTVHRLSPLFQFGNAPFIPSLLRLKRFDIIHLHHPFIFGAEMIWLVSKLREIPYVLTHHNDLIGVGLRRYLFNAYSAVSTRLIFGGAAKFAVVSKDHADNCRLAPLFRRRWDDVVEIPNGVDSRAFYPSLDGARIRHEYGISADARVVLFVGALDRAHHFKGVDYLINTFSGLEINKAVLMIIGEGDMRDAFEEQAKLSGIGERIIFTGSVVNEEMPPYYTAADVLVLPSFPPESFGMVLIEAMACGTPVIAHDIPGVRSVVDDGIDGSLVRPGDGTQLANRISYLLQSTPLRSTMSECGRSKVERKYAWPIVVSKLERVYEEVLQNTSTSPNGTEVH